MGIVRSGATWSEQAKRSVRALRETLGRERPRPCRGTAHGAIGGPLDNGDAGAAWVFTRSGTTWSQQGSKLVGSGEAVGRGPGVKRGALGGWKHRGDRRSG